MGRGIGGHQRGHDGGSADWLTPPAILAALGPFDTLQDNGLLQDWTGRVWLNPPYGPETGRWLAKLAAHGNGFAMIFARTETRLFFQHVWLVADGILFLRGRPHFHLPSGARATGNSGGTVCVIAYGVGNAIPAAGGGADLS